MYTFKKRYVIFRIVNGELEFVYSVVGKVTYTKNPGERTFETFDEAVEYLNNEVRHYERDNNRVECEIGEVIMGVLPVDEDGQPETLKGEE